MRYILISKKQYTFLYIFIYVIYLVVVNMRILVDNEVVTNLMTIVDKILIGVTGVLTHAR